MDSRDPSKETQSKDAPQTEPEATHLFPFIYEDKQHKFFLFRWINTFIRKASLWACSKLETFSILDRRILKDDLSNFHKITDTIYRGGQPLGDGFYRLKRLGIKTVINLRVVDTDIFHVKPAGLEYVHISFKPHIPRDCDVIRFLKVVKDVNNGPFYIHCYHGSDRTGMLCAIYRIFFQGWDKNKALHEMIHGGYGFHEFFQQNLISYIKKLDVAAIREKAGL